MVKEKVKVKMKIKKGDLVKVITGKYKGKIAKVLKVIPSDNKIVVENVNVVIKHLKPNVSKAAPQGGRVEKTLPIHASNVMLVCPKCNKATRVSIKREDNNRIRVCKKCGHEF